ncbi:MAG: DegT/DnrJ/EryC1/StrS family aminotransferase [Ferruginibacter sp.]|nr:DegT/DnrJ/EryC1/StrS family aminotransferase [Ferruginibacter sp.]
MRSLQMVDTKTQYLKIKNELDAAVLAVLESSRFIGGTVLDDFAQNLATYIGVKYVVPCANGTDALQIALMALDLKPGDEVITPSFTYIATVEAAAILQLQPVFVEVDAKTFCMDADAIEKAITPKTKVIVPVHLYGQAADMERIMAISKKHNVYVIEDNAQAIGCDYTFSDGRVVKTGSIAHIGCTSFYPSKNLGAFGDGGAIFTNDDALVEKLKMIAAHGQSKKYYHDVVGCNSRLDTVQAAVLDIKLKYLDEYNAARIKAADYYDQAFRDHAGISIPYRAAYSNHVFHQYTILLNDAKGTGKSRDGLNQYLAGKDVPSMIYYPVPCHRQKMFDSFGGNSFNLPVTDWLSERVISLPIHTELDAEQQDFIISNVIDYINSN